jgi:hypothetical protein
MSVGLMKRLVTGQEQRGTRDFFRRADAPGRQQFGLGATCRFCKHLRAMRREQLRAHRRTRAGWSRGNGRPGVLPG